MLQFICSYKFIASLNIYIYIIYNHVLLKDQGTLTLCKGHQKEASPNDCANGKRVKIHGRICQHPIQHLLEIGAEHCHAVKCKLYQHVSDMRTSIGPESTNILGNEIRITKQKKMQINETGSIDAGSRRVDCDLARVQFGCDRKYCNFMIGTSSNPNIQKVNLNTFWLR